jgi:hypothetical protein
MITSQIEALGLAGDVLLKNWTDAGLLHPSLLRMAKVATIDADLVEKRIGKLSAADRRAAQVAFRAVYAAWVR